MAATPITRSRWTGWRAARRDRAVAAPGSSAGSGRPGARGRRPRGRPAPAAVLVHRQQCPVPDRRGAGGGPLRGPGGSVQRGQPPQTGSFHTARVLRERGIGFGYRRSKHLSLFAAKRFDHVITLCDKVREVCPEFPGQPGRCPLEHPGPGRFRRRRPGHPGRLPARRRRARHQDRLPARRYRRPAGPGRVMTRPRTRSTRDGRQAAAPEPPRYRWPRSCVSGAGSAASGSVGRQRTSGCCATCACSAASGWMPRTSRMRSRSATCCPARPRPSWPSSAPGGCAAASARSRAGSRSSCPG